MTYTSGSALSSAGISYLVYRFDHLVFLSRKPNDKRELILIVLFELKNWNGYFGLIML